MSTKQNIVYLKQLGILKNINYKIDNCLPWEIEYTKLINSYYSNNSKLIEIQLELEHLTYGFNSQSSQFTTPVGFNNWNKYKQIEYEFNMIVYKGLHNNRFVACSFVFESFHFICTHKYNISHNEINEYIKELSIQPWIQFHKIHPKKSNPFWTFINSGSEITIDQHIHKSNLPMCIIPRPWIPNKYNAEIGGYLFNSNNVFKLINTGERLDNRQIDINLELICTINLLQCQSFTIDYEKIIECYKIDISRAKLEIKNTNEMKSISEKHKHRILQTIQNTIDDLVFKETIYKNFFKTTTIKFITKVYFIWIVDFRGRGYINNQISPTSDKHLRRYISPSGTNQKLVEFDATASVLQILGILTRSKELLEATNFIIKEPCDPWTTIINIEEETPDTLYKSIIYYVNRGDLDKKKIPKGLIINDLNNAKINITRNVIKYTIMRLLYGSNPRQIALDFKKDEGWKGSYKDILCIIALFYRKFEFEYSLLDLLRVINKSNIKSSGHGIKIDGIFQTFNNNYYNNIEYELKLKTSLPSKINPRVTYKVPTQDPDYKKSSNAVAANLFHCADSSVCFQTILYFLKNNHPILAIHDAFLVLEQDHKLLLRTYNQSLFNVNHMLYNIITDHKQKIDMSYNCEYKSKINSYISKLDERLEVIKKLERKIVESQHSLKKEIHE